MTDYQRQAELKLSIPESATVLGTGGVGWWSALFLAMSGVTELKIIDYDTVDASNLNRLPVPQRWVGKLKIHTLRLILRLLRPECSVYAYNQPADATFLDFTAPHHVIFGCIDKMSDLKGIYEWCQVHKIPYISAGYDGTHITLSSRESTWSEGGTGYETVPSWVCPAVIVSALAVIKALHSPKIEFYGDITQLGGK